MKLKARFLSALMTLAVIASTLCIPASAFETRYPLGVTYTDEYGMSREYYSPEYDDISELYSGQRVILNGMVDFNAVYNDGQYNYIGFNTDKGTWYILLGKYSIDAFKHIIPDDGSVTEFTALGTYAGPLEANNLPLIDIRQGAIVKYAAGSAASDDDTVDDVSSTLDPIQREINKAAAEQARAEAEAARAAEEAANPKWKKTGQMVWIPTRGGHCWHTSKTCSGMIDPEYVDRGYAEYMGFRNCSKC